MSPSPEKDQESGFGLVEVLVALTIFMFVAVGAAPFFLGALKSTASARLNLQAKALGQERIERMRNLPFHVGRQNGAYIDLLDTYFRDLNTTTTGPASASDVCSSRRYVAATSTYECTIASLGSGFTGFSQLVKAQFLTSARTVVTPAAGYTSQTAGADAPASNLLSIEVLTRWNDAGRMRTFPVRSQIANEGGDQSFLRADAKAAALRIQGNLADGDILELRGGLVTADATLTTGSRVALGAVPGRLGLASGTTMSGAVLALNAPPDTTGTSPVDPVSKKLGGTCDLACFGPTEVGGDQALKITNGLPKASKDMDPMTSLLKRVPGSASTGADVGFVYQNAAPGLVDTLLGVTGPIVSALGGPGVVASSTAFLDGTGSGGSALRTSVTTSVPRVAVNPTAFAPEGVVQLELTSAAMTCSSGGGIGAVTTTWAGKVRWMTPTGYQERVLKPGGTPLPDPKTTVIRTGETLDKYIKAWSAVTDPATAVVSATKTAQGELAGVLTVLTSNTRSGDDTSPITISLGSMSCLAEDNR